MPVSISIRPLLNALIRQANQGREGGFLRSTGFPNPNDPMEIWKRSHPGATQTAGSPDTQPSASRHIPEGAEIVGDGEISSEVDPALPTTGGLISGDRARGSVRGRIPTNEQEHIEGNVGGLIERRVRPADHDPSFFLNGAGPPGGGDVRTRGREARLQYEASERQRDPFGLPIGGPSHDLNAEGFAQALFEAGVDRVRAGPSPEGSTQFRGQDVRGQKVRPQFSIDRPNYGAVMEEEEKRLRLMAALKAQNALTVDYGLGRGR